ncbi:MAG: response regulator [Myxococcales bacterium FL481]|nr:MAG: response regulator [Myxococcales bacterium FL481]
MDSIAGYRTSQVTRDAGPRRVFLATRLEDDAKVIIKRHGFPPASEQRRYLRHEFAVLQHVEGDGVPQALELIEDDHFIALVCERKPGQCLSELLRTGPLPLDRLLWVAVNVVTVLDRVHGLGVIHRDIKPSNILVDLALEQVSVVDFGAASLDSPGGSAPQGHAAIVGTLAYVSPEQTGRTGHQVDCRSDLYSLGVVLYECLTGEPPFSGQDALELVHHHLATRPPPLALRLPELPPILSKLVDKLLSKAPDDRYQSAFGLLADLRHALASLQRGDQLLPFKLGERDRPERLDLPRRLYGRDEARARLVSALKQAAVDPQPILVSVWGEAGVGKSELVSRAQAPLARERGYYAVGKFDQISRGRPYAVWLAVLRQVVRALLVETPQRVQWWQHTFRGPRMSSVARLTEFIPELRHLVGQTPPPAPLGPAETRHVFHQAVGELVGAAGMRGQPVLLFLDDVQWADEASIELLNAICTQGRPLNLCLACACRQEEVGPDHPFVRTLEHLKERDVPHVQIQLEPLDAQQVRAFVGDALGREADELAELVHTRTGGNPFFVRRFLTMLGQTGALRLDRTRGWVWDMLAVRALPVTDNVARVLAQHFSGFNPGLRRALRVAAVLGNRGPLSVLASVLDWSLERCRSELREAFETGVLFVHEDWDYIFAHDRIQEAALLEVSHDERATIHRAIARRLSADDTGHGRPESVRRLAAEHYWFAMASLDNESEKRRAAAYLLQAAREARRSAAFDAVIRYLQPSLDLVPLWDQDHAAAFEQHLLLSEAHGLLGNFETADRLFEELTARARDDHEWSQATVVHLLHITTRGQFTDAANLLERALQPYSIVLPEQLSPGEGDRCLAEADAKIPPAEQLRSRFGNVDPADERVDDALELMCHGTSPVFLGRPSVYAKLAADMGTLAAGAIGSPHAPYALMTFASVLGERLGEYERALEIGECALQLDERLPRSTFSCRTYHAMGTHVVHWRKHLRHSIECLEQARALGQRDGDRLFRGYAGCLAVMTRASSGEPIPPLLAATQDLVEELTRSQNPTVGIVASVAAYLQRLAPADSTEAARPGFDDLAFLEQARQAEFTWAVHVVALLQARASIHQGDVLAAQPWLHEAETAKRAAHGVYTRIELSFFSSLVQLERLRQEPDQRELLQEVERNQRELENWADHSPENCRHLWLLVRAELAGIHDEVEAGSLFEQAIDHAREHGFVHLQGLAARRTARYWQRHARARMVRLFVGEAFLAYQKWGATRVCERLKEEFAFLEQLEPGRGHRSLRALLGDGSISTESGSGETLDLASLLKTSQAIAEEVRLGAVVSRVMTALLENAGAQRGALLIPDDKETRVATVASATETAQLLPTRPPVDEVDLPSRLIRLCALRRETLVIHDAATDPQHADAEYVERRGTRSMLCTPIVKAGRLVAIVYLENDLSPYLFGSQRIETIRLLSSQAATALENAALYEQLRESEERLRATLENSQDPILLLRTSDMQIVEYNRAAHERLGYTRAEFARMKWWDFDDIAQDELEARLKIGPALVDAAQTFESQHRAKDGSRFDMIASVRALEVREERHVLVTFRDVSLQHELEEQLRQSQKMEAVGKLAGGVAHDFNNLLTSILGHTDLIDLSMDDDDPSRPDLEEIRRSGQRAARLTKQLLLFSRRQTPEVTRLNMHDACAEMLRLLTRVVGENIRLNVRHEGDAAWVEIDPTQFEQIVLNLVVNARDALGPHGTISVITWAGDRYGGHRLVVEDDGCGMDEATQARIFEPFYTTKPRDQGTGLGLSTVYGIVKQAHGTVTVKSAVGRGTTFEIRLPVAEAPSPASDSRPGHEPPGGGTVLVVEDEDSVRKLVTRVLTDAGFRVLNARDEDGALEKLRDSSPRVDLVLSDIVLTRGSGVGLAERVRTLAPETRVLLMTGYAEPADIVEAQACTDARILRKPFSATALRRAVSQALRSDPPRSTDHP